MNNPDISPADKAAVILFQLAFLPVEQRIEALATQLAQQLGEGHTRYTVMEGYAEMERNDTEYLLRDLALKCVQTKEGK